MPQEMHMLKCDGNVSNSEVVHTYTIYSSNIQTFLPNFKYRPIKILSNKQMQATLGSFLTSSTVDCIWNQAKVYFKWLLIND